MLHALELITPPAGEPLTLKEAKAHLRVEEEFEDDDALITTLITAARQYTEKISSFLFLPQTWRLSFDRFPCVIDIPLRPLQQVVSLKYIDTNGDPQTLDSALYQVDNRSYTGRIKPAYNTFWPYTRCLMNSVEAQFVAGYGDGSNYDVTIEADWVTTLTVSAKTKTGFNVAFGSAAPGGGGTLTYTITRGSPAIELIAETDVAIGAAATSAAVTFAIALEGIPEFLKSALLLLLGHYYENREDTMVGMPIQTIPRGYEALIGVERVWRV